MKLLGTKNQLAAMWKERADQIRKTMCKGNPTTYWYQIFKGRLHALERCIIELEAWEENADETIRLPAVTVSKPSGARRSAKRRARRG